MDFPQLDPDVFNQFFKAPIVPPIVEPPKLASSDKPQPTNTLCLVRDRVYQFVSNTDVLLNTLQLDSDVYQYQTDGSKKLVLSNRNRYITSQSFKSEKEINDYLRYHGKIPSYLEIFQTKDKGFGVRTLVDIPNLQFLGYYDGNRRPLEQTLNTKAYLTACPGFTNTPIMSIDGENLTFANWTRFINDGANPNVEFNPYNHQVYLFTSQAIPANTELIVSYGESYWKAHDQKKLD